MTNEIQNFLNEINENNSTNYKLEVLKKHKDSESIKRVLKLTYDRVQYNFGIGKTTILKFPKIVYQDKMDLDQLLDFLEFKLATIELTGYAAVNKLIELLSFVSEENANIVIKILERDLRINIGRTQINKIHKDLIK